MREVAVYGGGVNKESMTLPSGSVDATRSDCVASDAIVADVIDAEVVIEVSTATEDADVVAEVSVKEAEFSGTLVELADAEETATTCQLSPRE